MLIVINALESTLLLTAAVFTHSTQDWSFLLFYLINIIITCEHWDAATHLVWINSFPLIFLGILSKILIKENTTYWHMTKNCLEAIFKGKFKVEDSRSWAGNKNLCIKSSLIWSTIVGVGVDIIVRSWGWWRSRRIRVAIINTISTICSCTIVSYLKAIIIIIIVTDVVSRTSALKSNFKW